MIVRAYAKINLSLEVVGVRADGYHELRTTFQSIALRDTLTFRAAAGPLRIACDDPLCPAGEDNLVWRAAAQVWRAAGRSGPPRGAAVRIVKRIPMQAGLGGGSSDAAAALRGFASLWRVRLARDRLRRLARALGADVPFFLEGGTAVGRGRGDRVTPLPDAPPAWVVVVVPSFGVRTKDAFAWWDAGRAERLRPRPPAKRVDPFASNDLQPFVAARYPGIGMLVDSLRAAGASHAAMSGSGSGVFGLFDRRATAARAAAALGGRGRVFLTRTTSRREFFL